MLKTTANSLVTSIVVLLIGFLYSVIVARLLGPEGRGIYSTAQMISALISGVALLGLPQAYIYNKRLSEKNAYVFLIKSSMVVILISVFLYGASIFIFDSEYLSSYKTSFFSLVVVTSLLCFFQQASQVNEDLKAYNKSKIATPIINLILIGCIYYMSFEVEVLDVININIFSFVFTLSILALPLIKREKSVSKKASSLSFSDVKGYSYKYYGTTISGVFINNIDKIFLMTKGSLTDFGLYSVAYATSRLIGLIPETFSTVIFSKFAGVKNVEISVVISKAFSCLFIPLILLTFLCSIIAIELFPLIFGQEYKNATLPFCILIFECVISGMGWLLAQRFNASGMPGVVFLRQILSIIPLIIVFVIPVNQGFVLSFIISIALLMSSLLRLFITIFLYERILNEAKPKFIPKLEDYKYLTVVMRER